MPATATAPPTLQAFEIASKRGILPTSLDTVGLRQLDAAVRRNAVFSARTTHAGYVSRIKEVTEAVLSGEMNEAEARVVLMQALQAIGYTPEGGFPQDLPGTVPPALAGSLQDLGSLRRLNVLIDTQVGLMRGAAMKAVGTTPDALKQFPFWEFVRLYDRVNPREPDWRSRINLALDNLDRPPLAAGEPLVFAKGDPVWAALGSSEIFDDALDVDHPIFAFGSGWGWRAKRREDVPPALWEQAEAFDAPATEEEPAEMVPVPKASTKGLDMDILQQLRKELDAEEDKLGVLTMKGRVKKGGQGG